ncbi:helix-turn-helix domain-containing protein [Paraburkholderia sp. BCC1884]|uniref:helix-turn-helix domain-containing protein n=1 Tax=Paraburkholderia sp. BCC1884 TaxID=2562668 RepID=UPI00164261F3|nr:AraC family transcriptional regulator [Paraburkholderia sp. BCC1884]
MTKRNSIQSTFNMADANGSITVERERRWRHSDELHRDIRDKRETKLVIGHWRERVIGVEQNAPIYADHFCIDVLLKRTFLECHKGGQRIYRGTADFGAIQITAPETDIKCSFSSPNEALHLFVSRGLLEETFDLIGTKNCSSNFGLQDPNFSVNPSIGALGRILFDSQQSSDMCEAIWSESLSLALLVKVISLNKDCLKQPQISSGSLPIWRQRRVLEFIDGNMCKKISLADMAGQAGLSRMHFASQFKRATGTTPHLFLLQKRVEKAKDLLLDQNLSIQDVAFDVGFGSQSHFTVVFRKLTGITPTHWRAQNRTAA